MTMLLSLAVSTYAVKPFLNAQDDKPICAKFRGTEWSDDIGEKEIPLTAQLMTTRIAKMSWGEFSNSNSRI